MTRHEFHLADGRILAWQEQGRGPSLVLVHGWSLSSAAFSELADLLGDFRVLLPDLPGHGRSSLQAVPSLSTLADDLAAWLATVAVDKIVLGGWSLGGMVAMELAARPAVSVDRLLLLATTPRFTAAADWPHVALTLWQMHGRENHIAARDRDYRLIHYADGSEELYDHRNDPHEWHNLAGQPAARAARDRLARHIDGYRQQLAPP